MVDTVELYSGSKKIENNSLKGMRTEPINKLRINNTIPINIIEDNLLIYTILEFIT